MKDSKLKIAILYIFYVVMFFILSYQIINIESTGSTSSFSAYIGLIALLNIATFIFIKQSKIKPIHLIGLFIVNLVLGNMTRAYGNSAGIGLLKFVNLFFVVVSGVVLIILIGNKPLKK